MRWALILLLLEAGCSDPATPPRAAAEAVVLPPLAESEKTAAAPGEARRIGAHRELPEDLADRGEWVSGDAGAVWRVVIRSPDAAALRLHFVVLDRTAGGVRIYEADPALRPPEPRAPVEAGPDGSVWSDLIEGEAAVVEFRPTDGEARAVPFRIDRLSHLWQSPLEAF